MGPTALSVLLPVGTTRQRRDAQGGAFGRRRRRRDGRRRVVGVVGVGQQLLDKVFLFNPFLRPLRLQLTKNYSPRFKSVREFNEHPMWCVLI